MNASVAIQVLPNVTEDEEVIRIVDEVIAYIKSFGLSTSVGPFETTIEGDSRSVDGNRSRLSENCHKSRM